ncbi:hypothetical protein M0208_13320 [Sphingomonas sp. SUN019]|uniref:hypothetical protein n=1 Tax=Sphingomonas sp. SUN019 TaxID=2937788 RepID=UPI0021FFAC96|nr:hypothetical protein M0208_13320 [Sphingomonas sp. SUN019]
MGETITGLITGPAGRRKMRTPGPLHFTLKRRQAFLDALALTCNVRKSADFAGIKDSTIYRTRRDDPVFAAQWQAALEMGYDRLEALALEHGGAAMPIEPDADRAVEAGADPAPFDFDKALRLLTFHRAARQGQRATPRGGAPLKNMTREETNQLLLKALAAAKKRVEKAQVREQRARGE